MEGRVWSPRARAGRLVRLANLDGRAVLVDQTHAVDVQERSEHRFPSDPQALFNDWPAFAGWACTVDPQTGAPYSLGALGPPVPNPSQVFAIGVNYAAHAAEGGYPADSMPVTFTKFPSCLTGPHAEVALPSAMVDWEVELVVVVGETCRGVPRDFAWAHVAGLMIGQDLSERQVQMQGQRPQFSLGKSYAGFGPTGPHLTGVDELPNPDDLEIACSVNGEIVQSSRTSMMIYDVPELVHRLSSICELRAGDLIFTGTPAGVGNARSPKRFLAPGDVLTSRIEGLGELHTTLA